MSTIVLSLFLLLLLLLIILLVSRHRQEKISFSLLSPQYILLSFPQASALTCSLDSFSAVCMDQGLIPRCDPTLPRAD